jgi:hypothetical protein
MSYCRFSSDDWRSDLYVYQCSLGWQIDIAGSRHDPMPPRITADKTDPDEWLRQYNAQRTAMDKAGRAYIDLPHAGGDFLCGTPGDCADTVAMLKELGYNVPDGVIEALREEQSDADAREGHSTPPQD